jgi:hypothetical protein
VSSTTLKPSPQPWHAKETSNNTINLLDVNNKTIGTIHTIEDTALILRSVNGGK